jgi:hypothetical protein
MFGKFIRKNKKKLKAACLAAGLATAWGGSQAEATTYLVDGYVQPAQALKGVYVGTYFWNASPSWSSWKLVSMSIAANEKIDFSFTTEGADLYPGTKPSYWVLGVYDETQKGVSVGFNSSNAPDAVGKQWEDYFPFWYVTETITADALLDPDGPDEIASRFDEFSSLVPRYGLSHCGAALGDAMLFVNFSTGTLGGGDIYADYTIIPEPSSIGMAGMVIMLVAAGRRRP